MFRWYIRYTLINFINDMKRCKHNKWHSMRVWIAINHYNVIWLQSVHNESLCDNSPHFSIVRPKFLCYYFTPLWVIWSDSKRNKWASKPLYFAKSKSYIVILWMIIWLWWLCIGIIKIIRILWHHIVFFTKFSFHRAYQ